MPHICCNHGPTGHITSNNEMYRALEHIEGEIIQGTIETLRSKYGLFSHALIHDAILIHKDIPDTVVMSEFKDNMSNIQVRVGEKEKKLQRLELKLVKWEALLASATSLAYQYGYSKDKDWTQFTRKEKAAHGFARDPAYDHRDYNVAAK